MKKQLLLATSVLVSGMIVAQVSKKTSNVSKNLANISTPYNKIILGNEPVVSGANNSTVTKPNQSPANNLRTAASTTNVIGTTWYDLQSNSSVPNRIVVNSDNSVAACWTFAVDNSTGYTSRGTAYNYFNGTAWGPQPTARLEPGRTGWGVIVNTRTGKELVLAHNGTNSPLNSRAVKGTGAWTENTTAIPSATTAANMWPRMVSSGDTVYAIYVTYTAAFHGVTPGLAFSRSSDGGATWDILNKTMTGIDSTRFLTLGGDSYAIAAKGSTVVVVAGDSGRDLVMSKSTDGGVTWTYKVAMKFPIPLWDWTTTISDSNGDNVADTIMSNDGNLAVSLDKNNQAVLFYGRARILQAAPAAGFSYFPYTDGLMMWKESFAANTDTGGIMVAAIEDLGEKGSIYFPPVASGIWPFGSWGSSLTSYPSIAIDAAGAFYLTYSSVVDSLSCLINPDKLVRHVYIIKSSDGGINWTNPCDLVGSPNGIVYEGMFASLATRVNGSVHLIYQRDLGPGNAAQAGVDAPENTLVNDIIYVKIPTGDVGTCTLGVGIEDLTTSVTNLNLYPNPASTNATIDVVLKENAKMEIVVLNSVGQTVYSSSIAGNAGSNKVDVNLSNLSAGLYFYQVRVANSKSVTKKFVIEK